MMVAVQDREEIEIPDEDWRALRGVLQAGEKPFVELSNGQWINFQFVKRLYNRFDSLPKFEGGDPAETYMKKYGNKNAKQRGSRTSGSR